jgi:hypothetical protein
MSASKALDKAQAIGRQAVTRMMKPPPPPQAAPGSKVCAHTLVAHVTLLQVVYTDHTMMPTRPNATWDELPPSYRIYPDPSKRWMPVAPADFKFVYWNHIADTRKCTDFPCSPYVVLVGVVQSTKIITENDVEKHSVGIFPRSPQ